jgi:hypothetical protein
MTVVTGYGHQNIEVLDDFNPHGLILVRVVSVHMESVYSTFGGREFSSIDGVTISEI